MTRLHIPWLNRQMIFGAFAAIAVVAVAAQVAAALLASPIASVNTGRLNVREGPSAGYRVIATISIGTDVEMFGRNADASWVQIRLSNGATGWVSSLYLNSNMIFNDLPITASTAEPYGWVTTGRLNMRTGPGTQFPIVATLTQYDTVSIIGISPDGNWALIRAFSLTGWANAGFVGFSVDPSFLPRLDPAAQLTSPPLGPVPTFGDGLSIPAQLNVYSAPSITSPVLRVVGSGTAFDLAGRDPSATWIQVLFSDGAVGWVDWGNIGLSISAWDLPIKTQ